MKLPHFLHREVFYLIGIILLGYLYFYLGGNFIGDFGDPIGQTIPNKTLLAEFYNKKLNILWNPLNFLGMPFLADLQVGAFYFPDIFFFSIFPPFLAHNISVLFHISLAAISCYYLLYKLCKEKLPAITGASILALTGTFLSKLVFLNFIATLAYTPLLLLFTEHKDKLGIKIFLTTLIMLSAGHPVAAFYTILVTATFVLYRNWGKAKIIFEIAYLMLCSLLSSAIFLLPFWELKNLSLRDRISFEEFIGGRTNILEFHNFIIPIKDFLNYPVDKYIHFGTIAFFTLIASIFFYKKFSNQLRKLYLLGLILCGVGIFLATLGFHHSIAKIIYQIPILNLARVSARYIFIFHLGAIFSITAFLTHLVKRKSKWGKPVAVAIIINSIITPLFFLEQHKITEGEKQYFPEIKTKIEELTEDKFSLTRPPIYFLASSNYLFPNRHFPNKMHNIIGYNPMMPKQLHKHFPVDPVGAFSNPNYLQDYFPKLIEVGLKYYIFPTENELKKLGIEEKIAVTHFLKEQNFSLLTEIDNRIAIWKNQTPVPFVYFQNPENQIESINYHPGNIVLTAKMKSPDTLIANQAHFPGWIAKYENEQTDSKTHNELVQSYKIDKSSKKIILSYQPQSYENGTQLSLLGFLLFIAYYVARFFNFKPPSKT